MRRENMQKRVTLKMVLTSVCLFELVLILSGCMGTKKYSGPSEYKALINSGYPSTRNQAGPEKLPELDDSATLSDYLAFAALNNPGVEAAFSRWRAALEKAPQVSALPDPRLSLSYYIEEVETRVGPQRWGAGLSQSFPWFGTLGLRGDVADQDANIVEQGLRRALLDLYRDVKVAYYEYYYVTRAIAITEENIALMTELEEVARTEYKTGGTPYSSVIKAQVELGILDDRLQSLKDLLESAVADLNAPLNRPPNSPLPLPVQGAVLEEVVGLSDEEVFALLAEINPELEALDIAVAREEAAIELAGKGYYPEFNIGLNYIETDRARMGGISDSGKDPVIASISMSLPFLSNKYSAAEREAENKRRAAVKERRERENQLLAELKKQLFRFRDGKRKVDLYRDTLLPKADQSLNVSRQSFETGKTDFLDLIDAERVLLEFQLSAERALVDQAKSYAELDRVLGGELPSGPNAGRVEEDQE